MPRLPGSFVDVKFGLEQVLALLNGKLDVVENLSLKLVESAPGAIAANTQQAVQHRLGRVPRGVIVAGIEVGVGAVSSVPGIIYFTSADLALWTEELVYLRYTVNWTAHTVTLILF